MKSTFVKCVWTVDGGPNPAPMEKMGKQRDRNPKSKLFRNGVTMGGPKLPWLLLLLFLLLLLLLLLL